MSEAIIIKHFMSGRPIQIQTKVTICSLCTLTIFNFSYFPFLVLGAGVVF